MAGYAALIRPTSLTTAHRRAGASAESGASLRPIADCASLHPGYRLSRLNAPSPASGKRRRKRSMTMTPSVEAAAGYPFAANAAAVTYKILSAVAAIVGLCLFCSQAVLAQPMRCSGEQKVCVANCNKANRASASVCATDCGARQSLCMKTGCWDNGTQKYCGLLKQ